MIGSVFLAGIFSGQVDFDISDDVFIQSSAGGLDAFLLKLDYFGDFEWAYRWGSSGNDIISPTVRHASRRDLPGKRIAAALSVASDSGATAPTWLNSATSHERGVVNGLNRLSGGIMLKRFFRTVLCSVILIGKIHAQEVVVAREKKPELPTQTPQPAEQLTLESPTPAPRKSKSREKKSAPAALTLEEMRAAGARAAEGANDRSISQSTKTREADVESAPVPRPTAVETRRPAKRETPVEQRSSPRPSKSRGANIEGMGPIRPTMMESGREAPSPSPSGR
jgi:hypothetical protein